jgi:hypothetical protein
VTEIVASGGHQFCPSALQNLSGAAIPWLSAPGGGHSSRIFEPSHSCHQFIRGPVTRRQQQG